MSSSADFGRFPPGHLFGQRYRIVRRLGRGGMGEVYLADDLKLGQSVALKFLPEAIERDPERLSQLQNEVRLARQVSHPNVCRVYDLGEADAVHFLTMEYIDGEDLASLLRRIGRLPEDRAVDLARQLAAGAAAAHERGVLHRDLKPANVMLDAEGRLRVTDFGLAVAGETTTGGLAGTPAYMAPEQLSGMPASEQSDVFAIGLILYELFTGRRAYSARTIDELKDQHATRSFTPPTEAVTGLNPAIDRVITRCLELDPSDRPASALAVAAALPGGDPLAAALAAGETPSLDLVAAAGGEAATLSPSTGVLLILAVAGMLAASTALGNRFGLPALVPLPLSWDALEDRARSFADRAGAAVGGRASGFLVSIDALDWIRARPDRGERASRLDAARPPVALFWYRTSPRDLVPTHPTRPHPTPADPPMNDTGMATVALDTTGRLIEYVSVPSQIENDDGEAPPEVEWVRFFEAAGLDLSRFEPADPRWTPRVYADERLAWTGTAADLPDVPLRIEAASHRGVPVNFQIVGPWSRPVRMVPPPVSRTTEIVGVVASAVIVPACLVGGLLLARRNLRRGRGDRRGAVRLALFVSALAVADWIVGASHFASLPAEQTRFAATLAFALMTAALYGLMYLAIEPHVRRIRPMMLVTWSRIVSGRLRDPMVGRDLAIGAAVGTLLTLVTWAHHLVPGWFGWQEFAPPPFDVKVLSGGAGFVSLVLQSLSLALQNALIGGIGIILLRLVFPDLRVVFVVATLLFSFLAARGQVDTGRLWLDLVVGALLVAPILGAIVRYGFIAGTAGFFVHFLTKDVPTSFDPARLDFGPGAATAAISLLVVITGFVLARGREPVFGRIIVDE